MGFVVTITLMLLAPDLANAGAFDRDPAMKVDLDQALSSSYSEKQQVHDDRVPLEEELSKTTENEPKITIEIGEG